MWATLTALAELLRLTGHYNNAVWNAVTVLETLCIGRAFYLALYSNKSRYFLRLAAGVFLAVAAVDNVKANPIFKTTVYATALGSALLLFTVLLYFEQMLHNLRLKPLEREPMFVVGVGVLLYFASATCFFLLEVGAPSVPYRAMMTVNAVLCVMFHCIIARAFWLAGQVQPVAAAQSVSAQPPTAYQ